MLPDWDFDGDEAKRRAFIEWVWTGLDRLAVLTTDRFILRDPSPPEWETAAKSAAQKPRPVGKPPKADAERAGDGMDAALWDYMLLKFMFDRYWPGRSRPISDPAHPARIAARRNQRELRNVEDHGPWGEVADEQTKAEAVHARWKQWKDRPGRRMAGDDMAYLKSLPDYFFAQ